jgi:hypothetical protein
MRALVMASALALASVLAGPAAAATFVFDVTVTQIVDSANVFGPGLPVTRFETHAVPFSFQVSYEIGPVTEVSSPFQSGEFYGGSAVATATPPALEADLLAASGFSADQTTLSLGVVQNTYFGISYIQFQMTSPTLSTDTESAEADASIQGAGGLVGSPGGFTPQKIDLMLRSLGPLSYQGEGQHLVFSPDGSAVDVANLAFYLGTATYRSDLSDFGAVPEPASWALMIGGFALIGAALRRRRSLAAAA